MHPEITSYKLRSSILTQGDTGNASVVRLNVQQVIGDEAKRPNRDLTLRVRVTNNGTHTNSTNATIAPTAGYGETVKTHTSDKDLEIRSVPAEEATGTLTISGVVVDGETVLIGDRTYYYSTGLTSVPAGNVTANISAYGTKAAGNLTLSVQATEGDTFQIGPKTYVMVANGTANTNGEVSLGGNLAVCQTNIVAAINGTDSVNTSNSQVSAGNFSGNVTLLTALYTGTQGNSIVTAEIGQGFTDANNTFDATTLGDVTAGVDVSAANAVTALVAAINGDASAVVSAADGASDTVVITADTAGADGNDIATTETMTNGEFDDETLTGGTSANPGEIRVTLTNATAETVDIICGPPEVGGMPVDYSGAIQEVTHA